MSKKLVALLVAALPISAQAATDTWDFSTGIFSGSGYGNTFTVAGASGTNNLTMTGWSDTGGSNDDILESGYLDYDTPKYSLTLQNQDHNVNGHSETSSPGHSIDNFGDWTDTDMVLLSFHQEVTLESLSIGWATEETKGYQADITVVGYTGKETITGLSGNKWEDMAAGSWNEVETLSNVQGESTRALSTTVSSKYWLIGAFNVAFSGSGDGLSEGFKLSAVTGSTSNGGGGGGEVPAPNSVLLLLAGLLSLQAMKRKSRQAGIAA